MQIRVFIQTLTGLMSGLLSAGEIFVGIKSPGKDVSRGRAGLVVARGLTSP